VLPAGHAGDVEDGEEAEGAFAQEVGQQGDTDGGEKGLSRAPSEGDAAPQAVRDEVDGGSPSLGGAG